MVNTIGGIRRMVVKSAIKEHAEEVDGDLQPGSPEYRDLMHNVEAQVQTVLEEEGYIEY